MTSFFVEGVPMPKGSLTAIVRSGRAVLIEGRRKDARQTYAEWMQALRECARVARGYAEPEAGAVTVGLAFFLPRPKSAKKRAWPTKKPDLDKLLRAVLDALTGVAFVDDAQVVRINPLVKEYAGAPDATPPGVQIWIERTP